MGALTLAACSASGPSSSAVQQIPITANEFKVEPATIEFTAGRPVKLTLHNKGTVEHDWASMKIPLSGKEESSMGARYGRHERPT